MDIEASSKVAVVPFLSKHIPDQYTGQHPPKTSANTKYCYRHHPDLKCRRQADEPTMEEVQKGLEKLPVSDQQAISHVWTIFSAAPASQRILILQGILTQCCFPQLSFISGALRDLIRIDFISALPPELSFRILSFLDTTSLCKAAQVSRRWRTLADDDVVWHKMCEQHIDRKCTKCGWGLPLLERKRLRQTKRQMELRAKGKVIPLKDEFAVEDTFDRKRLSDSDEDPETTRRAKKVCRRTSSSSSGIVEETSSLNLKERRQRLWKDVYSERYKVESNWRRGRYQSKILKGHENGIVCIQFDDTMVATGSYDRTVKIWDIETATEIRTLRGHTNCVRALQFDETKLISGSLDNTLRIWNWRTGQCINILRGHQAGVVSLHFEGELLASGSVDTTIRLWNFNDKRTAIFRGHTDWVNAVRIHGASNTLFSASDDTTVKMWDLTSRACIRTFTGHVGHVQQCFPLNLESFDEDECMGDAADVSSPGSDDGPHILPKNISRAPTHMLTAALDTTVKLWDVATGRCIKTLFGHTQGIWGLSADSLRAITGAEDGMLKIWDIRTGKCERTVTQHVGPVTCVALSDSRMMSGGQDGEAILYCFKPKT
ncbi:hypothetical protein TWF106_001392 [Orbilia oligospora]|uniref:F-box domain-containing protein n=1 Tax=Orbilia oligospora TaxID=2813651 RepID=A0A7C8QAL5_ORBOL|nr:hypothetical protein TWF106_001392 [Orbilia oligospora]